MEKYSEHVFSVLYFVMWNVDKARGIMVWLRNKELMLLFFHSSNGVTRCIFAIVNFNDFTRKYEILDIKFFKSK